MPGLLQACWRPVRRCVGRHVGGFIKDVRNDRIGVRDIGEPIAVDLDPSEPVLGESRVWPRVGEPGLRTHGYLLDGVRVGFDEPTRGRRTGAMPGGPLKIPLDDPEILVATGCRDPDRQGVSSHFGSLGPRRYGCNRMVPFVFGEHLACFGLHRVDIVQPSSRDVVQAYVERLGDVRRGDRVDLPLHGLTSHVGHHEGKSYIMPELESVRRLLSCLVESGGTTGL